MAEQESQDTQGSEGTGGEKKGGIVRLAGLAAGLFVLMSVSQLTTMIVASKFLPGTSQGAQVAEDGEMAEDGEEVLNVAALEPPQYASLNQPLVVSYQSDSTIRFLQLTVEAMARDEDSISAFTTHTPAIRNNLLTLFASLDLNELATVGGKEKARAAALAEVQSVLASTAPEATIEDIYFTSFVVQ